jgi:hypothetical protein
MAVIVATSPSASLTASLESVFRCSAGTSRRRRAPTSITLTRPVKRIAAITIIIPTVPHDIHNLNSETRSQHKHVCRLFAARSELHRDARCNLAPKIKFLLIVTTTSSSRFCRLVLLRNENLEIGRALRRRIYWPTGENDCRSRCNDCLCFHDEFGRQPAFLRR